MIKPHFAIWRLGQITDLKIYQCERPCPLFITGGLDLVNEEIAGKKCQLPSPLATGADNVAHTAAFSEANDAHIWLTLPANGMVDLDSAGRVRTGLVE